MKTREWLFHTAEPEAIDRLVKSLGVSPVTAQILIARGITDANEARNFLNPDLSQLNNPFLLRDMDKAAMRVATAIRGGEQIRIHGDYDADGITATTLLVSFLRQFGANVDYHLPHRLEDGYGLHMDAVEKAAADGVSLMITVDCGITAFEEARRCRDLGLDLVITDHHEPHNVMPDAMAVINPKRRDSAYPFHNLAGVGVALKLARAIELTLAGHLTDGTMLSEYLDLAAFGTIADVMPLLGENRVIVRNGLEGISSAKRPGMAALLATSGLSGKKISSWNVAFGLAPRINAAGRLASPELGISLFLTDSPDEAYQIAETLNSINQERQAVESEILQQALAKIETEGDMSSQKAIVLAQEGWHPGVIGIVASRLVEIFHRPAILISIDGDEGRGSGRSIPGFDLYQALNDCRETLIGFGGHELAAGLTIRAQDIGVFTRRFLETADSRIPWDLIRPPKLYVDAVASLEEISEGLASEMELLSPFGAGNPAPVVAVKNVKVLEYRQIGADGKHIRMRVGDGDQIRDVIGFGMGDRAQDLYRLGGGTLDIAFCPEINEWNGTRNVRLNAKDFLASQG